MSEQNQNPHNTGQGSIITREPVLAQDRASALSRVTGQINRSTLLMGLMFAVGLGWVLWESQQIQNTTEADEVDTTGVMVDSGIEEMSRQVKTSEKQQTQTAAVVDAFYYEPQSRQIAISQLRQNPFGVKEEIVELATTTPIDPPREEPPKPQAPPVDRFNLQSVVLSDPPSAMISGRIVTEGQIISGWRVILIERRSVTLKWQDQTYRLKMNSD